MMESKRKLMSKFHCLGKAKKKDKKFENICKVREISY